MRLDVSPVPDGDIVDSSTLEIGWRLAGQWTSSLRWIRRHDPGANVTRFGRTALVTFTDRRTMREFLSRLCRNPSGTLHLARPIRLKLRPRQMRNTNFDAVRNSRMRMALRRGRKQRAMP